MQPLPSVPANSPKKQSPAINNSVLESLRDLGSGIGSTLAKDVIGGLWSDALTTLFGQPAGGDFKRPQITPLESFPERSPFRPAIRRPEVYKPTVTILREEAGIKEKLDCVRQELKKLSLSIRHLNSQIERAIDDIPVHPGVYHVNFLERIRGVLLVIRENIENSGTWLNLCTKRSQKKNYWGMYKKHGTSFGLSSERNVANQAG